jgi:hypothetical protein
VDVDRRTDDVRIGFRAEARNRDWDDIVDAILATPDVVRAALE